MLISTGIDAVEITRFINWKNYKRKNLRKIFTDSEIDYALSCPTKSAERFAIRYAAKEAAYKALSSILKNHISFTKVAKYITVKKNLETGCVNLEIDFEKIDIKIRKQNFRLFLSCSHTRNLAIAQVLISKS